MDLSEFLGVFLEELNEQFREMEHLIVSLEQSGPDSDVISRLFRAAHTVKGSSGAMGFESMTSLTHAMEQLLDELRNGRLNITHAIVDLLFECYDQLQVLRDAIGNEGETPNPTALIEKVKRYVSEGGTAMVSTPTPVLSSGSSSYYRVVEAAEQGLNVYRAEVAFTASCTMRHARSLLVRNAMESIGEIVELSPELDGTDVGAIPDDAFPRLVFVVATQESESAVRGLLTSSDYDLVSLAALNPSEAVIESTVSKASAEPGALVDAELAPSVPVASETGPTPKRRSQTIRVDVDTLESLMNLVGELVIDQARLSQVGRALSRQFKSNTQVQTLGDVTTHVSRIVSEMQERVMMARMLPIESLFDRFPRIVRDLSKSLSKEIDLVIEGRETRLDRTVIEEISDPLIHLIRNSVDHGVESAEVRARVGKPAKGRVRLAAAHEDNKVVITVQDDGRGIEAEAIKRVAVKKGVISAAEAEKLSDSESVYLIFRPGFSTAETVSDISGRGVGMDIVRNHIEKLNGTIDIQTTPGVGTTFRIKLPLTLAIIPGLLVGVGTETYVVPMNVVAEIVRVTPQSLQIVCGRWVLLLRGIVIPVVNLSEFFAHATDPQQSPAYLRIVVAGSTDRPIAMVVDEFLGNQEIVKKSLGSEVTLPTGISGATILGDGRVGLILDVGAIANSAESRIPGYEQDIV